MSRDTQERMQSEGEIEARLKRHFPTIDTEIVKDFAFAISRGRYLYNDAKRMLKELVVISSVQNAVVEAIEEEKRVQQQQQQQQQQRRSVPLPPPPTAHVPSPSAPSNHFPTASTAAVGSGHSVIRRGNEAAVQREHNELLAAIERERQGNSNLSRNQQQSQQSSNYSNTVVSAASSSMELDPSSAYVKAHEAVLYVTSMTASRQVRYHCRLMRNLLYMRRVRFTEFDIADNPFLQRQLQKLIQGNDHARQRGGGAGEGVPLPLLFIGEQFVGNYEQCQAFEDDDRLLTRMEILGFRYDPAPVHAQLPASSSEDD